MKIRYIMSHLTRCPHCYMAQLVSASEGCQTSEIPDSGDIFNHWNHHREPCCRVAFEGAGVYKHCPVLHPDSAEMGVDGHLLNDYIAGAIGGAAGLVVGHPFDTTKVQLQTQQGTSPYRNTWDAVKNINHHGWTKGFFRGLGFPLVSYGVVNSIFFGVYGNTLRYLRDGTSSCGKRTNKDIFIAGCVGGVAQLSVACPVDVVKVVLQSQISKVDAPGSRPTSSRRPFYKGPVECLHKLYHHGGIRTCYSGFWIQGARDVPASATYFMIYENLSAFINRLPYSDSHGVAADLLAGGTAGVVSWTLILPLDVIKSQVQANAVQGKFNGAWHCAKETYLRGGVRVFFTGLGVASLRAFPTNAVIFLVYSQTSKVLNRRSG